MKDLKEITLSISVMYGRYAKTDPFDLIIINDGIL